MNDSLSGAASDHVPNGSADGDALRRSEARYRALAKATNQAVWCWSLDGRGGDFSETQRWWEELTGQAPGEQGDQTTGWLAVVHPDDRDAAGSAWGASISSGIPYDVEYRVRALSGGWRHVRARGVPVPGPDGAVAEWVGTLDDVTDRRATEATRREGEERFRGLMEQAPFSVQIFAPDGRTLGVNRAWEQLWGLTLDQLADYNLLADPQLEAKGITPYLRRAATGESVAIPAIRYDPEETIPGRTRHADPQRWVSAVAYPLKNPAGRVREVVLVHEDITERVKAEAERTRLTESLSLVLGAAALGTWEWDPATDQVTLSARAAELFSLPADRTYSREWMRNLIRADYRDRARDAAARAVGGRAEYDQEYPLDRGGWVAVRGRGVYDADGRLTRKLGVVQDVTERKRAEADLRASEERYRVLVSATSDVVYRMNADWTEMYPVDGRRLVASNAEPIRDWMQMNVPPGEHARVRAVIARAVADTSPFELEHRVTRDDGTSGWTLSRAAPILDAAGDVVEWFGTARDVTAQKHAQDEVARVTAESDRRKRLYETVLSATPDFVYVFSLDHRVLYANDALIAMWGRGHDGAIGKTFLEIGYEPWHAAMHDREIDQVRATKQPIRGEVPFQGTLGRRVYDYIFVPVLGADGEVEAVAGTTRDVTDRKAMEDDLREADRKKDEFIALLAHELRNPLAPIRNGLQVIRLSQDRAVRERSQQMMDRQLSHMVRLIDDLLDVSRIGRNKMELRRARVTLAEVVGSAAETAGPAIEEAGHGLTVSLPPRPVYLDADLTRLAQVFSNLLTNSAKYMPRGGRIWLSAEPGDGAVAVSVRDTGIGIPAESLPTIFDMFSQIDRSIERTTGGLGIGLALVKGLVEMHGGTVTAASAGPGRGSTFTVTLPTLSSRHGAEPAAADGGAHEGPSRRILVVDDNRDGAETLSEMLRLLGHDVGTAHDGLEAVAAAEARRPEVILMDIGMPRLNGLEATQRIRSQEWGRGMTIIALTGWGQDADRARSREAGCDQHLVKPVNLPDLERVLGELQTGVG